MKNIWSIAVRPRIATANQHANWLPAPAAASSCAAPVINVIRPGCAGAAMPLLHAASTALAPTRERDGCVLGLIFNVSCSAGLEVQPVRLAGELDGRPGITTDRVSAR